MRDASGRLLLVRDPKRGWEPPGGTVEPGEDFVRTLRREILEEAGVEVAPGALACLIHSGSRPPWLLVYWHARHIAGEARPSPECPEVAWVSDAEALGRITHPMILATMRSILAGAAPFYRAYTGAHSGLQIVAEHPLLPAR